jgi:hypothetical protein
LEVKMLTSLIIVTVLLALDLTATWFGRDTRDADDWFEHGDIYESQGR